jgi:hypothetical protein
MVQQTVLAVTAIDELASRLIHPKIWISLSNIVMLYVEQDLFENVAWFGLFHVVEIPSIDAM